MPSSLPRWIEPVLIGFFPVHAAFPESQAGRHPQLHFRGLLKVHLRYGLQDRSPAYRGLYHGAPLRPVTGAERPVSYHVLPISTWVESSSTGDLRRWGALRKAG